MKATTTPAPTISKKLRKHLDFITRKISAFDSFDELVNAKGGYTPSIYPWRGAPYRVMMRYYVLARQYDLFQEARGDSRRAYTAGH